MRAVQSKVGPSLLWLGRAESTVLLRFGYTSHKCLIDQDAQEPRHRKRHVVGKYLAPIMTVVV